MLFKKLFTEVKVEAVFFKIHIFLLFLKEKEKNAPLLEFMKRNAKQYSSNHLSIAVR